MSMKEKFLTAVVFVAMFTAPFCIARATPPQGSAEKEYKANCVTCHSLDGSGSSPAGKALKAKDLKSPEVQSATDADLTAVITNGNGKMPAFGKKLSADVIKGLVAYIRSFAKK
jgi:mono/diheme cytochrome c family protein